MMNRRTLLTGTAVAAALTGCADPLTKPFPERRFYTLDVVHPQARPARADGPVLVVRRFRASPGYDDVSLLSRTEPLTLRRDFYNQFLVPPSTQITDIARRWFADSGLFREVVVGTSQLDPTHTLEGALVSFYGDFSQTPPTAQVHLQLLLLDVRAATPSPIARSDVPRREALPGATPDALVAGYQRALGAILGAFESTLARQLA